MGRSNITQRLLLIAIVASITGFVVSSCGTAPRVGGESADGYPVRDEPHSRDDQPPADSVRIVAADAEPDDDRGEDSRVEIDRDPHASAHPDSIELAIRPEPADRGAHHDAELDAIAYRAAGEYFKAISAYAVAVQIASENAAPVGVIDRIATGLEETIREISLTKRTDNLSGIVRRPVEEAFVLEVTTPRGPLASVPITVAYREVRPDGRSAVRTASLETDAAGRVEFVPPSLAAPGRETVSMVLDLSSYIAPVTSLGPDNAAVARIAGVAAEKRAAFAYIVESRAREILTSTAVVETDIAGNPLSTDTTANAMIQHLNAEGFAVTPGAVDARVARNLTDDGVIRFLRDAVEPGVQRVVFGTVAITGFEEDNGFVVTVRGEVSVIELETGATVLRVSATQRSRGQSSSAAISSAFRAIGTRFGQDFATAFP